MTQSKQTSSTMAAGPGFKDLSSAGPGRVEAAYQSDINNPNRLQPQAQQYLSNTLQGQYLDPSTNPHLASLTSAITDPIQASLSGQFGRAGRGNSGDAARYISEGMTRGLAQPLFAQYNQERGLQHNAASLSGAVDAAGNLPLEQYLERMRNMSLLGQKGTQTSTPSTLQTLAGVGLTAAGMFGTGPAGMGLKIPGMGV